MEKKRGAVLVEVLQGATLTILVTTLVFVVVAHLWTRTYVQSESFYLARARLYQNNPACGPSERLLPAAWVQRHYQCLQTELSVQYHFLPGLREAGSPKLQGTWRISL